jgi:crotonobetaine/carnitine-CoA ligase
LVTAETGEGPAEWLLATPSGELNMVALLERAARERPADVFFTHPGGAERLAEFNALTNRIARNLKALGVDEGAHVAVLMDSSREYFAVWFALAKLGSVEIAINPAYKGDLLAHQLVQSGAVACIAESAYTGNLVGIAGSVPGLRTVISRGGSGKLPEAGAAVGSYDFDRLLAPNDETNLQTPLSPDGIAGMVFTSGTTGPSKAVVLSHAYTVAYGLLYAEVNELDRTDVILNFQPVFHMTGKFVVIAALAVGGRMHVMPRFSVRAFWDEMREHGVTNVVAIGGVCKMLLAAPPDNRDFDNPVRVVYAVPDPVEIHEEFEKRFGCTLTTVFGSSEIGLPAFQSPSAAPVPGSCGRRSPHYEVQVVDDYDRILPLGSAGEIVVRPKHPFLICSGYYGQGEKTVSAMRNLWFHTGDRGRFDDGGYLWFVDRTTDSLRRRGENISSFELESQICRHPAVAEAVAVAAASDVGEDEVWVLVRPREGASLTHEELMLHCASVLPYFMIPRYFDIVDDFPRTPTSKIEKYLLREAGPSADTWDREKHGWIVKQRQLTHVAQSDR